MTICIPGYGCFKIILSTHTGHTGPGDPGFGTEDVKEDEAHEHDTLRNTHTLYAIASLSENLNNLDESLRPSAEAFIKAGREYLQAKFGDKVTISL